MAGGKPTRLPKAATPAAQLRRFYEATGSAAFERVLITRADGRKDQLYNAVHTPDGLDDVRLTDRFVHHVIVDTARDHREQFAEYVLPTLQDPAEVYLSTVKLGDGRTVFRQTYLGVFADRKTVLATQEDADNGVLAWTFFPVEKFKAFVRKGTRIYP